MSRLISYSGDVTVNLTSYSGASSSMSVSNQDRAANSSANTTYATFSSSTQNQAAYAWYIFENVSIPNEATIDSVSCDARIHVYRNGNRGTTGLQLMAGDTAKGSETNVVSSTTSASTVSVAPGSWVSSDFNNNSIILRLRITRTSSSGSQTIRFYGATLKVVYSVNGVEYEVTINNSTSATTGPTGTTYVFQGGEQKISIGNIPNTDGINVKDNNVDVTAQLVTGYSEAVGAFIPSSLASSTRTVTNPNNGLADSASTTFAYMRICGGTSTMVYAFDTSSIPNGASIISVECTVKAIVSGASNNITNNTIQLYTNTTAKGTAATLPKTSATTIPTTTISDPGSWTLSEIRNIRVQTSASYNSSTAYYIRFYGASLTIKYTDTSSTVYIYTISNISADHTIVISDKEKMKVNVNGTWVDAINVYKNVNNSWQLQSDLTNLFDNGTIYVKGN